ncbi:hypothetical protein PoB_002598100 [Plakobranchus ocellatus]|uniref:Uncharacterized protein n=1 Tax=Plakobranchus ocellatus TaxID=259542 RepID=A0AAV3ZY70_9GAST|nr:hypothetical protein PoB_002598100 [Plakobranchus ocellatus]
METRSTTSRGSNHCRIEEQKPGLILYSTGPGTRTNTRSLLGHNVCGRADQPTQPQSSNLLNKGVEEASQGRETVKNCAHRIIVTLF